MSVTTLERPLLVLCALIALVSLSTLAFAASAVSLRIRTRRAKARRARLEAEWEPLVLDILAGELPVETLWIRVPANRAAWLIEYLLRVARRLRGDDLEGLAAIAEPYLALGLDRLHHRSAEQRAFAVETINVLGRGRYKREIATALDDRAPLVAMIAARALTHEGEPEYLEAVIDRLHRFETWSPRLLASLLASIGPSAGPVLRRALADRERPLRVRTLAATALKQLNVLEAADDAVEVLESENDRELLASALRLLSKVGRPEQAATVRKLCRAEDFVVRAHALTALARLGSSDDAEVLRDALGDESSWVAIHAATGLKEAGHLTLLRNLAGSEDPRAELARQVLSDVA